MTIGGCRLAKQCNNQLIVRVHGGGDVEEGGQLWQNMLEGCFGIILANKLNGAKIKNKK